MSSEVNETQENDPFDFDAFEDEGAQVSSEKNETPTESDPFAFGEEQSQPSAPAAPSPPKAPVKTKAAKPSPKAKRTTPVAKASPSPTQAGGASLVEDAPVQVAAILGKKQLSVGELVGLKKGEVVELNRFPNEAIDLVANGKLMAKGELVEVDGKLGVRIIKIF